MRFVLRTDAREPAGHDPDPRPAVGPQRAGGRRGRAGRRALARRDRRRPGGRLVGAAPGPARPSGRRDDRRRQLQRLAALGASPPWTCWPGCPAGVPPCSARCSSSARRATRAIGWSARPPPGPSTGWSWSAPGAAGIAEGARGGRDGPGPRHPGPRCRGRPRHAARPAPRRRRRPRQGVARDRPGSRRRRPPPRPRHGAPAR